MKSSRLGTSGPEGEAKGRRAGRSAGARRPAIGGSRRCQACVRGGYSSSGMRSGTKATSRSSRVTCVCASLGAGTGLRATGLGRTAIWCSTANSYCGTSVWGAGPTCSATLFVFSSSARGGPTSLCLAGLSSPTGTSTNGPSPAPSSILASRAAAASLSRPSDSCATVATGGCASQVATGGAVSGRSICSSACACSGRSGLGLSL